MRQMLTPKEIADHYGVTHQKVLEWIHAGELKAMNVATKKDGKLPRFLVSESSLQAFEHSRSTRTQEERQASRRKRRPQAPRNTRNWFER